MNIIILMHMKRLGTQEIITRVHDCAGQRIYLISVQWKQLKIIIKNKKQLIKNYNIL